MDATTCEQYVLAELEAALAANERLQAQVEALSAEPTLLERLVTEKGRKALFDYCTKCIPDVTDDDGERVPFDAFCEGYIYDYNLPKWTSKAEFACYFEPEFWRAYQNAIAEEQE